MNWRNWWKPASEEQPQTQPETLLGYLLEPRMVFDGAVVATTVEVAADAAAPTPTEAASDATADSAGTGDATASDSHHDSSLYVAAAVGPEASGHESAPVADGKAVVFVDTSVSNYQGLLAELPSDIEVVLLDGSKDGLSQMADWAQSHTGYEAIHIISHGAEGSLTLGATQLNSQSLASHSGQLQTLGQALTTQGDILLYGCDVAAGTRGQQFIGELATLTGADVAASSDDTGSASLGGNWQLEQHVGTIEAHVISSDRYSGLLATFDLTDASGNGTKEIMQTVGSDTLVITAKDTVLAVNSDVNFWGGGIGSVSDDVILSDSGLSSESQITLTVSGNKIFDLSSFVLVDYAGEGKGIRITTDKGSETFSAAFVADGSWSLSLTGNSNFQGITYAKIETSDPSGQFCWAFDNFVLNNIQLPDTTAPDAPSTPVLDSASDLGSSNSDGLTSDNTPTFSGTAEPGSLVKLYRDDFPGVMGMTTADASGNWTITSGYLTNGTHTMTATATDAAGNVSVASAGVNVTIDLSAPATPAAPDLTSASDSGISNSDNITNNKMPTLSGTAENNSTVTIYDGGVSIGSTTADGSGNWSFTTGELTAGTHNLTATAGDAAGNTSAASAALSITIDTGANAPSVPDLTVASDSGISSSDNLTNDTTPTLTGTAEADATVTVYDGGTSIGTATADGFGNWSFTPSALGDGAHNLTATQTDVAGNVSDASAALTLTIDASTPAVPSAPDLEAASDSGHLDTDNLTNDTTPTFSGTADAGSTVTLYDTDGTTVLGSTTADGSGHWSITSSTLDAGAHTLTAVASDAAGNHSVASTGLAVTIDAAAPSAPSTPDLLSASDSGASSSDNLTNNTTPTLTGTAEANATVTVYDGGAQIGSTTADGSGNWSFTPGVLTAGAHILTAKATDGAGNTSAASAALTLIIDTAVSAPSVPDLTAASDSGISSSDNLTNHTAPTLTGTAEANATVTVYFDGASIGTALADGSGNWSFNPGDLSDGVYNLTATQTDVAGNVSVASAALTVTIDTLEPGSASGSLSVVEGSAPGSAVGTVTASDGASYSLLDDAGGRFAIDGSTGAITVVDGSLLDFESATSHSITVQVMDAAGNTRDTSLSVTIIDSTNEAAPVISSNGGGASATVSLLEGVTSVTTISASDADAGSTLSYSIAGGADGALFTINPTTGALSFVVAPDFEAPTDSNTDNSYDVTVQVSDGLHTDTQAITVNVGNSNDAPTLNLPTSIGVSEDVLTAVTGISFSDVDAGSNPVTVTLAAGSGALTALSGGGVIVAGSGSSTLVLSGSVSAINNFIATSQVGFTTVANSSSDVTLAVTIDDGGNSGSGGVQSANGSVTLDVSAVNDAPSVAAPGSIAVTEDVASALTGISFTDVDAGSNPVTVTLAVNAGTLAAVSGSGVSVGGSATSLTLSGSISDINSFIAAGKVGFTTASNDTGNVTLTTSIHDGGNTGSGGAKSDSTTTTLSVSAVNDAPVNQLPSSQFIAQDASLVFSSANGNPITISDVDAGAGTLQVTLTATHGVISLSGTTGLSFSVGDGSSDQTMTFEGSAADINNALNGLSFTPSSGFSGAATLSVATNDLGGTGSGGSQLDSDSVTISINNPPTANPISAQNATEDAAFSFTLPSNTFSDVDVGDSLSLSATLADGSPLPSWLSFDASTGTFSGTPDNGAVGSVEVRVTATDGSGASVSSSFMLTVANSNDAPVSQSIANQNATEDSAFSFTLPSNTFSDVDVGDALSLSATLADGSPLPSWLSFDASTGTFSGTPDNGAVGSVEVRVTATDGSGASASSDFSLNVANSNDAPLSQSIADQNATEDAAFNFTLPSHTFSDVDAGDSLSLSATLADGSPLPSWLSFNPTTGTFTGTPDNGDVGSVDVRVTATDGSGASVSSSFMLSVANSNDAPLSQSIASQNATEDNAFSFTLPSHTFSDVDVGDSLSLSSTLADGSPLPSWLSFDASTGTFSGTPDNGAVGSVEVRVTATDGSGASASSDFSLTVANSNDAPVSHAVADQSASAGSQFHFQLPSNAFTDVDAGDSLTLNATLADGSPLPSWLSFDAGTGTFSGVPGQTDISTLQLQITATDSQGATAVTQFQLVVGQSVQPGGDPEFKISSGTTSSDALVSEQGRELVLEPEQAPTEIDALLAPAPLLSPRADSGLQASSVFADSPFAPGQAGSVLASIFQRDHGPLLAADSWLAPETRFTGVGGHSTLAELFMTRALDSAPALQVFDHSSWHSVLGGLEGQEGQPVASLSLQQQLAELEQEQAPQRLIDAITQTFAPGERQSS